MGGNLKSLKRLTRQQKTFNAAFNVGESLNFSYRVDGEIFRDIKLIDNPEARNPTYTDVVNFLKSDKTDEIPYTDEFSCMEFAATVHNNAEEKGLRCAVAIVEFEDIRHACNVFKTVDRGVVFSDSAGSRQGYYPRDSFVKVQIGKPYIPRIIPNLVKCPSMGIVESVCMIW